MMECRYHDDSLLFYIKKGKWSEEKERIREISEKAAVITYKFDSSQKPSAWEVAVGVIWTQLEACPKLWFRW